MSEWISALLTCVLSFSKAWQLCLQIADRGVRALAKVLGAQSVITVLDLHDNQVRHVHAAGNRVVPPACFTSVPAQLAACFCSVGHAAFWLSRMKQCLWPFCLMSDLLQGRGAC